MRVSTMIRPLIDRAAAILAGSVVASGGWTTFGQDGARPETPRAPATATPGAAGEARKSLLTEGEAEILAVDDAFVRAYNKGDSKVLGAMFAEDAEVDDGEGDRQQGRDLIEKRLADTFATSPGARIAIETDSIRFLTPDVAKEEGRSLVTPAEGPTEESSFTVLYVKRDGRWLISSIREEPIDSGSPHDRLKALEWMVGEWIEESEDSVVRFSCRWAEGGNFLLRDVVVKREGKPVMSITQRIGWDPTVRKIRSWEFDSAGGFGVGLWSRDGDRWTVKHTGVQADGAATSATNIMTKAGPDAVSWTSTDRVVGDASLPDSDGDVLVRVPPPPLTKTPSPTAPTEAPNTPRN